jgi:hypothetical protein
MEPRAIKFIDEEKGLIGGFGLPYGGPMAGKDLQGEKFTPQTDFCEGWFRERPVLYHHGLDPDLKADVIGHQFGPLEEKPEGRWINAQLDKSHRYWDQIKTLIKAGKLFWSSHAPPHLVTKTADGEITRWPTVEFTLTPTPANPYGTVPVFKSINLDSLGASSEAIRAIKEAGEQVLFSIDMAKLDELSRETGANLDEITAGLMEEMEHSDVTEGDSDKTLLIVAAHLREDPKYYSKLQSVMPAGDGGENKEKEIKMEKPAGSPTIEKLPTHADPEVSSINGEKAPPESSLPVNTEAKKTVSAKGLKCSCGKAIVLPPEVVQALQALSTSVQGILGGQSTNESVESTPAGPDGVPQSGPPGQSQGMSPENHIEKSEPEPGETAAHEASETSVEEATEAKKPEEKIKAEEEVIEEEEKEKKKPIEVKSVTMEIQALTAVLSDVKGSLKAIADENSALKERIRTLESQPASQGPVRSAVKAINEKMDILNSTATEARKAMIDKMMEEAHDPSVKSFLGNQAAMLEMRSIQPQDLSTRRK